MESTVTSLEGVTGQDKTAEKFLLAGRKMQRLFDLEGYKEAIPLYMEARELEPESAPVRVALAETYSYWGFRRDIVGQECRTYYELSYEEACNALEMAPERPESHRAMAIALRYGARADPVRRVKEAEEAFRLNPYDAENCYEFWRALGFKIESSLIYKTLALDPSLFAAHNDLGVAHFRAKRLGESKYYFQKALAINPRNVLGRYNMAMVLAGSGRHGDAISLLEETARLHPDDPLPPKGIALLQEKNGKTESHP